MTSISVHPTFAESENYLTVSHRVGSWLLTKDHKRIAILYMISITFFFAIGGAAATLMRITLLTPNGSLVEAETYNKLFTIHGVMMVWFFLIPSIPTVLGNFLVPLMIGAKDLAFPKINLLSWYLFITGGIFTLLSLILGGVDTGWTFYTPYSSVFSNSHVMLAITGIFISGFSSILTGLNFIVSIHTLRALGMTWFRMPLFLWSMYATSLILVLATPVLAITLVLVAIEHLFHGVGIFNPEFGGDPLLFQHLFWFYSHPAVYIMILPGMGVMSELITCFSRKRIFGYEFVAFSSVAIAGIGFLVWGHHMFVAGVSMYGGMIFSSLSFLVAVPSAIKVFNWTATLYKGSILLSTPMLYAGGFIGLFTLGGLTGLMLATLGIDMHVHDTYFVIAHFHYIMVGGMVMAYLGGIHFWWPKITGRLYSEMLGQVSAVVIFLGFNLTFFPQFVLGYLGMPPPYHAYPPEFQVLNVLSSAGASILALGYLLPLCYLVYSLFRGETAGDNPWGATGLEWTTTSPPPTHNFDRQPIVTDEAYAYHLRRPRGPQENPANETGGMSEANRTLVAEQFADLDQQEDSATLGMWTFLATEVLFFGVLFASYTICRIRWPSAFREGSLDLKWYLGAINTAVLLGSSYMMAMAVRSAALGHSRRIVRALLGTIGLAVLFLAIKGSEYYIEWREQLVPWLNYSSLGHRPVQEELFMSFYFTTTAIHATHMVIGIVVMFVLIWMARRGKFSAEWHSPVEMTGLYWHFVDIVWVFLFPALYLLRNP